MNKYIEINNEYLYRIDTFILKNGFKWSFTESKFILRLVDIPIEIDYFLHKYINYYSTKIASSVNH